MVAFASGSLRLRSADRFVGGSGACPFFAHSGGPRLSAFESPPLFGTHDGGPACGGGPCPGFSGGPCPGFSGGPCVLFSGGPWPGFSGGPCVLFFGGPCPGFSGGPWPGVVVSFPAVVVVAVVVWPGPFPFPLPGPFPLPLPGVSGKSSWPAIVVASDESEGRSASDWEDDESRAAVAGVTVAVTMRMEKATARICWLRAFIAVQ